MSRKNTSDMFHKEQAHRRRTEALRMRAAVKRLIRITQDDDPNRHGVSAADCPCLPEKCWCLVNHLVRRGITGKRRNSRIHATDSEHRFVNKVLDFAQGQGLISWERRGKVDVIICLIVPPQPVVSYELYALQKRKAFMHIKGKSTKYLLEAYREAA